MAKKKMKQMSVKDRVLILETKFDSLLQINKWQLGMLSAILLVAITEIFKR